MKNYTINFIYNNENDINDIFIRILKKEIKNHIKSVHKNASSDVLLSNYLIRKNKGDNNWN